MNVTSKMDSSRGAALPPALVIVALVVLGIGVVFSIFQAHRASEDVAALGRRMGSAEVASSTLSGLNDAIGTRLNEVKDRQQDLNARLESVGAGRIDALTKEVAALRAEVHRLAAARK